MAVNVSRLMNMLRMLMNGKLVKANYRDLTEAVYALLQLVPPGKVTTYGSIARTLGISARLVGRILAENKKAPVIPCHRVVMSDGRLGGYSMGGKEVKRRLLELEGVKVEGWRVHRKFIIDVEGYVRSG